MKIKQFQFSTFNSHIETRYLHVFFDLLLLIPELSESVDDQT